MSILTKLRESRGLSCADLAEKIEVSPEELEEWEESSKRITKSGLSSLAYFFGLSSEELKDAIEGRLGSITTSQYHIFRENDLEDGWWGHFGVRLNGQDSSKWFPITLGVANRVSHELANTSSRERWLVVETLNNRILVFKPISVSRLWLLDEAADPPGDDWEVPWDGYSGKAGEFYKALEEYYWVELGAFEEKEVSPIVREDIEAFTDSHDLDIDDVGRLVVETQIYNVDGTELSYNVDESRLVELVDSIELEDSIVILDLSNHNCEMYIPADAVCLIDMPKRRVEIAVRDRNFYLEELENEG